MDKYVSRKYLREKWDMLKWDMEKVVGVYEEGEDNVAQDADKVRHEMSAFINAILMEINK